MSDYLQNLVNRSLDPSRPVRPRLASLFEPPVAGGLFAAASPSDTFDADAEPLTVEATPAADMRSAARPTPARADTAQSRPTQPPTPATRADAPWQIPSDTQDASRSSGRLTVPAAPHVGSSLLPASRPGPDAAPRGRIDEREATRRDDAARRDAHAEAARAESKAEGRLESREAARRERAFAPLLVPAATKAAQAPRSSAESLTPAPDAAPTIRVTIGRIDVRAVFSDVQQQRPRPAPARPHPALTLEDYLRQRKGGAR
jgi:hypothetical protein